MKFQTSKSEKSTIFYIFWHNISTTLVGWSCFQTNTAKTQNRYLEQNEVKFHWDVFVLLNNRNICKTKPHCKILAFFLKSLENYSLGKLDKKFYLPCEHMKTITHFIHFWFSHHFIIKKNISLGMRLRKPNYESSCISLWANMLWNWQKLF